MHNHNINPCLTLIFTPKQAFAKLRAELMLALGAMHNDTMRKQQRLPFSARNVIIQRLVEKPHARLLIGQVIIAEPA